MKLNNRVILILIIIVAATLRLINYCELPFTHDEFSALFRLNFDSFSELIEKGVKIDGHPAGVQVYHSVKLSDINLDHKNLHLKTFIWNKGKESFLIDNFTIEVRKGNPVIYGLTEKTE
jgi:hypothetical protein